MTVESAVEQVMRGGRALVSHVWLAASKAGRPAHQGSGAGVSFFKPDGSGLPGISELRTLADALGSWALIIALVGLVIGAAVWALGSHSQNYHQSVGGRRAVLVSGAAALLVGAAPGIISFFFSAGKGIHG